MVYGEWEIYSTEPIYMPHKHSIAESWTILHFNKCVLKAKNIYGSLYPFHVEICDANGIDFFCVQSIAHADTHARTQMRALLLLKQWRCFCLF